MRMCYPLYLFYFFIINLILYLILLTPGREAWRVRGESRGGGGHLGRAGAALFGYWGEKSTRRHHAHERTQQSVAQRVYACH